MIYEKYEKMLKKVWKTFPSNELRKKDINLWRDKKLEYNEKIIKMREKFKQALFKEYGIENNPKKEKCWNLAWSYGHSSGYSEVENYFADLVELIKYMK